MIQKKILMNSLQKKLINCNIVIQKIKLLHFQLKIHLETFFIKFNGHG